MTVTSTDRPGGARSPGTDLSEVSRSDASLRTFLHGLSGVDAVGLDARAAMLGTRSIKTTAKATAIDLAIRMIDLTTLEGADTPGKVRALCAKAQRPDAGSATLPDAGSATLPDAGSATLPEPASASPGSGPCPPVAAVCVYPSMVPVAVGELAGTGIHVASVATAFPSGQVPLAVKLADIGSAIDAGADEIDMVINRGAFLSGRYLEVFDEIVAARAACGSAHLKVILETGELGTYDNVRRASWIGMLAGAHFIKTSTGKVAPAATPSVTLIMLEAVRDMYRLTGRQIGVKPAGGIRTSKDAIKYLVMVNETVGEAWLDPDWFRFGASTLLNDLLMQRMKLSTGRYTGPDYVSLD